MNEPALVRLKLCSPLVYANKPELKPFSYAGKRGQDVFPPSEQLFCFELNAQQSRNIEPEREHFLGQLVFAGFELIDNKRREPLQTSESVILPSGLYLFAQKRQALDREACIDMAIEQQKDGLWEGFAPAGLLYIRYLFEDAKPVTQVFRPC
jgi:hypothetical protein